LQNIYYVRRRVVDGEAFPDEGIGTVVGVDLVSPCNKRTMDGSDVAPIIINQNTLIILRDGQSSPGPGTVTKIFLTGTGTKICFSPVPGPKMTGPAHV
jgi:hypothetical protein